MQTYRTAAAVAARTLTDDELLQRIRDAHERLGRVPKVKEVDGWLAIVRRFGGWPQAVYAAGFEPQYRMRSEHLLALLRGYADELGRTPKGIEVNANPTLPSTSVYYRRFGTYRKACEMAGLDTSTLQAPAHTYTSPLDAHLRRQYGMTEAEFHELSAQLGHRCQICRRQQPSGQRLHVDHCHTGGHVRGLLCHACNNALGLARDDPELLRRMAEYLERAS